MPALALPVRRRPGAASGRSRRPLIVAAGYLAAFVATIVQGYWILFVGYSRYDDEGYMLQSLRAFVSGRDLYEQVFSQYGPFYYEVWGGLFALSGQSVGMDAGRAITLVVWCSSCLLFGLAAHRFTGRWWIGIATQVAAFSPLVALKNEPMHPVGLITLLLAATACVIAFVVPRHPRAGLAAVGAIGAALALTKINVGGYLLIAAVLACALCVPWPARRRPLRLAVMAFGVALPVLVMGRDWSTPQVRNNLVLVVLATLALVIAADRGWEGAEGEADGDGDGDRLLTWAGWLVAGAAATTVVVLVVAVLAGAPAGQFAERLVGEPARLRDLFLVGLTVEPRTLTGCFLAVGAAVAVRRLRIDRLSLSPALTGALRIAAGVLTLVAVSAVFPLGGIMALPPMLAWVAAVPPRGARHDLPSYLARVMVVAVAVLQCLHAYPVAFTQVAVAGISFVVLGGIMIADGLSDLSAFAQADARRVGLAPAFAAVLGVGLTGALIVQVLVLPVSDQKRAYDTLTALPFQSADQVHVPPEDAARLGAIVSDLRTQCSTFVTAPGMNAFYEWTLKPPPTGYNPTFWMRLLSAKEQAAVVRAVRGERRLCVLRNDEIYAQWLQGKSATGPLVDYLATGFVLAKDYGGAYQLFVRDRQAVRKP